MTEIPGPQGGPLGGGGPEIPGGFSQGPFYGPPEWVSYNVPPQLRLGMTDVQQNGTSRGGVPLYQGTDQYGREWQWSARGPIGYRDDEDGIWHEVSEQDGIWHDRWTDQNGWARHSTQDAQGNHLSTTSSHPEIPLSPPDAFTDAIKDDVFAAPPPPPFVEAPPDAFKDNVFAEPPPYQEPPPEDFKDNVFADPPPPDGDIQVRLPDAFKDNAVESPPSWSYGDIQVRPPEDFIDKAVEPPPYQEPPPEEPPVAEQPPPPGAEGGEEEQLPPPVTQTPEAEPPVQPTPPPPSPDGDIQELPPDAFKDKAVEPPPFRAPKLRAEQDVPGTRAPDPGVEGGEQLPPPVTQTPEAEPPVQPTPPPGDADDGGIPGLGVPYRDFIPFAPMVKDPTTGQWRNAEPGEIAGAEGGEVGQPPPAGGPEAGGPPPPGYSGKFGEFGHTGSSTYVPPVEGGEFPPDTGTDTEISQSVQQSSAAAASGGAPPPAPYGEVQQRPPDAFKDNAFADDQTLEPIPSSGPSPFGVAPPSPEPPPPPGDTEDPGSQAQEVSALQFGNTANFQNAPDPNAPPGDEGQPVPGDALQFGNTANFQNAPAEPPVVEQQPAPALPYEPPATGMPQPDGDGDGIPNEYGDGPDLDANGIPDEVGINPDVLQDGYPGGVLPDGSGSAIPGEHGYGLDLDGNWVPDGIGIDPDGLQPGSPYPSASGYRPGGPYPGQSDPYGSVPAEEALLPEEPPVVPEGEDPNALGSF